MSQMAFIEPEQDNVQTENYVHVVPYNCLWPDQFRSIAQKIEFYLHDNQVTFTCIEHIGSTSVSDLPAKNNIDILILVPNAEQAEKAKQALIWGPPAEEHYKYIGDGGIEGRISMKYQDYTAVRRSVYIIREDDAVGMLHVNGYRALRDTLRKEEHEDLKLAYGAVKLALAEEKIEQGFVYGRKKNDIIRQILKVAGWTDEEVDLKESFDRREAFDPPTPPY